LRFAALPYFCGNFFDMEMKKRSKGLYWLVFFFFVALTILAVATHWPWLTLLLPFVFTSFVLALDIV
jgi:hypothetical protein